MTALVNIFSCYFVQNISIFSLVNFLDNARTNAAEGFIKESNILFKSFGLIEKLIAISCFIAAARSFIHLAPLLTKIRQHLFLSIEGRRGLINQDFFYIIGCELLFSSTREMLHFANDMFFSHARALSLSHIRYCTAAAAESVH